MKNIVNRALVAKKKQFQSKSVPRGTRTIWRYLGALFILFTFAIGNVWAADITVTPPAPNNASNPFSTGLYVMSFSGTGSKLSSGAITTGTKGAVITINFQATKSDMYIKTITFNSLGNGTLSSDDGTFDGQVFTATGNKNSVNVVLTSGSGQKGTVKVTNVVVNTGTNVVETITFTGVDSGDGQKATFTSSAATSALSSITTDASAFSVSSGKLSWTNGKKVILTAESNIKYVAFSIADGKMYDNFSAAETTYNSANYSWSGSSKTVTLTNGSGGGREIKGLYVIIDPVVKHHVTYLLGGDYGTTPTQADVAEGGKFTLHNGTTGITAPENKTFAGWNDGTTTYEGGAEYTMGTSDVELTAQWATSYDISYDKGTYGAGEIAGGKKAEDVAYTLSSSMFTRENYLQVGWATSDGASRSYMIGGSYTTNAAQTFYPAWAEKDTYVAAFHYDSENPTTPPAGWTFANAGTYTNTSATVAYVGKFTAEGETTASGKGMNLNHIAFAKSADADAVYDLGYATTVSAVTGTLMIGSTSAKVASIDYLAADGSTVLHSFNITHNKADWGANNFNETEVVPNVRYIRINGKDFWQVLGAFSVTYGSLVPKYDLAFAKNGGSGADMATLRYAEDANVALPACSFTAPENKEFDAWVVTKAASGNPITVTDGKFTMPAEAVTATATWKFLPKLTLEAGEGATGDDVVAYYAATTSIPVPAKPEGFSNGTKEFTGWVYSSDVEITDGAFPMPSSDLTLTAQWASATAVAQIVGGDSYETFAAAIAAVTDGQTIQLLQDIDVDAQIEIAGVDITIDLSGHKIEYVGDATLPSGVILVHNGASLTINDSSDPDAGSIVSGDKAYAAVALTKLGDDASTPATLVVNGGALTGYYYGITGNGSRNNTDITINGGTITGTVGIAIYHPQVGTLTVNDGSLTGVDAAIEMRAGTLVINNGTFTATATEFSCNPNGSGSTTSGAAIAIAQHTTKKEISVTINGGTFNGVKAINESNPQVNDPAPEVAMEIKDGDFNGEVTTVDVNNFISGGTFDHEVAVNQCAEGYAPEDNGDGTYGVKPLATSIDFEALATTHGTGTTNVADELAAKNYTFSGSISTSNGASWDAATAAKPADKGLKIKGANGATLSFDVAAGKLVTLKVGSLKGGATIAVNGGAAETLTGSNPLSTGASVYTYYYSADVATYSIATTGTDYDVIQSVTIEDPYVVTFNANGGEDVAAMEFQGTALTLPSATKGTEVFKGWYDAAEDGNLIGKAGESYTPTADVTLYAQWEAVSSDATLSALEVDGATVAGFDPETYIYNIVCEYGHTPEITLATATAGDLATVTINNEPVDGVGYKYVQVKVVPQSGEEGKKFYQVRYTNLPKKGVSLIKVTIPNGTGNTQTIEEANITGYIGGTATQKLESGKHKLGSGGHFIGMTLAEGTFQENDLVIVNVEEIKADLMRVFKENTAAEDNVVASSTANMTVGDNYVTLGATTTNSLYLRRGTNDENYQTGWNPFIGSFEVQRLMDPFIESFEIEGIGALDINPTTKAITASVPESFDVTALTPTIKAWANGSAHLDKSGAQNFTEPVTYKVTSDYAEDGEVTYTVTITKVAPSATPTITTQPVSANYVEGASINALTVVAESTAGELSYQWQVKNGLEFEDIDGATAASYTPTVSAIGSYIYRVVVTNIEESKPATSVESEDATIVIAADPSCATFVEASIPTEEPYQYTNTGEWTIYNASSSGKRNGSDQVFTNVKDFEGNTVKGYAKERCVMIFEKDMKQVRFYSANAQRSWGSTPVQVSGDVEAFLGTSTPSYSADAATTSLIQADPSNNKEQIFIAEGEFLAGKVYWFAFSGSLQIFQICAVEADPKAEAPVFSGALSDEAICEGGTFATLNATASPVTSYAWYKDGVVIDGAEAATYTPTEAGTYYCIATNAQAGHRPNSLKSAEAVLSVNEAASVTMANVSGKATASIALNAVATGANPHYVWYTCDDAEGNNAVAIEGAADAASYAIPTPVATQYYKVVVTTDCGSVSAVALVTLLPDIVPLADVTENTVWDWTEITARADGSAIDEVIDNKNHGPRVATANGLVLANYVLGGSYWDKIEGNNNAYAIRNTSNVYYQGASLHMHTTKGGILKINARNDGSAMKMKIGSAEFALTSSFEDYVVYVPAGDVTIENVPETAGKPMRVKKITFTVKESPDYTRPVSSNYGTLCVEHNVLVGGAMGATFYQIASRNEDYDYKIDFEEVLPNEELKAGEPYLFKSNTGKIELFYGAETAATPQPVRGMIGSFVDAHVDITSENMSDILYIANNRLWNCEDMVGSYLDVVANRAYIVMSDVPEYSAPQQNSAPRRRVSLGMNSEQVATGCENLNVSDKPVKMIINGQLFILRGEKMYDAKGQLVK